jgi:hypothetical protein
MVRWIKPFEEERDLDSGWINVISVFLKEATIDLVWALAHRFTRWVTRAARVMPPAFFLPLLLYALTLAPTIYNLDSAELTTAVAAGGILRATGYPLYLFLGKLWTWLPIGDVGYRMNLFSAVCGGVTIFLADRTLLELRIGPWARLGALGLLAAAPYFWALSLIAEVYTLHTALMAGVIYLLIRWSKKPGPTQLAAPVFLTALSMGNHASTALLLPGIFAFVLFTHPREVFKGRVFLASLIAGLLGSAIFAYLPLRYAAEPAFNYAGRYDSLGIFHPVNLQTLEGLIWLITGRSFAGQMFGYSWLEFGQEVLVFAKQLWRSFFGIGFAPGIIGLIALWKRRRPLALMLLLMFLGNAIFYTNYRVIDKATMFLPNDLVWALWLGLGFQVLLTFISEENPSRIATWGFRGLLVLGVVTSVALTWSRVDLSGDRSTRDKSERILMTVEPDALIFGWWDTIPGVEYLQYVEGWRPDVTAINRFLIEGEDMERLILREMNNRPIYVDSTSAEILREARTTRVGPLTRLEPRERTTIDP